MTVMKLKVKKTAVVHIIEESRKGMSTVGS